MHRTPLLVVVLFFFLSSVHGQTRFAAMLDASQVVNNPSDSTATGLAQFTLNAEQTELEYSVQFFGLDLKPVVTDRTDENDVLAIHIHLNVVDVIGPHILNIFGNPSEDDADLVIDYENESLSGVYDMSDASRDPDTGEILPQAFPLTTKLFPTEFRLEELLGEEWYIVAHTVGSASTPPGVTIRGNLFIIPEPATGMSTLLLACGILGRRGRVA